MICDLCNAPVTAANSTRVPALVMRSAVLRGFNPFTTPGFGSNAATTEILGISVETVASDWRERALKDNSDWLLCQDCHRSFVARFGGVGGSNI